MINDEAGGSQSELLRWARGEFIHLEAADPAGDARELMEWVRGVDNLWAVPDLISSSQAQEFVEAVLRRRNGEPLQHITRRMYFYGLTLECQPGVFICRPETELLAEAAITELQRIAAERQQVGDERRILCVDLCAGSGAIGIAIAAHCPQVQVVAVELNPVAADLARRNSEYLVPGRVSVITGNACAVDVLSDLNSRVTVVVTNPPYVPGQTPVTQIEAQHDPELALYGGGDRGLEVPTALVQRSVQLLESGGRLLMEHDHTQGQELRQIAVASGFTDVVTLRDLAGKDRFLSGRKL